MNKLLCLFYFVYAIKINLIVESLNNIYNISLISVLVPYCQKKKSVSTFILFVWFNLIIIKKNNMVHQL